MQQEHTVLTEKGWKPVAELEQGDVLAVAFDNGKFVFVSNISPDTEYGLLDDECIEV